jgi:hypothetical protein
MGYFASRGGLEHRGAFYDFVFLLDIEAPLPSTCGEGKVSYYIL